MKKNIIDATTQSNLSSHEESNTNNQYNSNDKNQTFSKENFISNDFQVFNLEEWNNNQNLLLALSLNKLNSISSFQDGENNNNIDSNIKNNVNNDSQINDDTNTNIHNNFNYIPRSPIQAQKKAKKQKNE